MSGQFPALLVVAPLLAALVVSLVGWVKPRYCFPVALCGLGVAAASALGLLIKVLLTGPVLYKLGGWDPPIGIAYRVDLLNGVVLAVVSLSALLNLAANHQVVLRDFPDKIGPFYALYTLAVTGLLGIVVTGDAFNLYVLLEISSLTGYALIGLGPGRAQLSALNYLMLGTIGASFYLLGVGYLYIITGSLNMTDIARLLPPLFKSRAVLIAFVLAMVGLWLKMAFFPLHTWLPNAYSQAPPPAASLLAPLMTKVMIYVMIRLMLTVFTPAFVFSAVAVKTVVVWLATAAIVAGALFALAQRDLRRMLTYIIVAEVGYMVGGAWLGNRAGMTGAVLHIINDAVMTLCVFLTAGMIHFKARSLEFVSLKGLFRKMPLTMMVFVVGAMGIIGVPPTCGFFSKWYLIKGALAAGNYAFMAALIFSSLVSVVLFFRVFEIAYFEPLAEPGHGDGDGHGHGPVALAREEAPMAMLAPALLVGLAVILLGVFTGPLVSKVIAPAIPAVLK